MVILLLFLLAVQLLEEFMIPYLPFVMIKKRNLFLPIILELFFLTFSSCSLDLLASRSSFMELSAPGFQTHVVFL